MATYRDIDLADQAQRSRLEEKALTAEMALFLVDGLRDYMKCPEDTLVLARKKDEDNECSNEVNAHLTLDGDTVKCRLSLHLTDIDHDLLWFNLAVTETTDGVYKAEFLGDDDFPSGVRVIAEVSRKDSAAITALFEKVSDSILSFVRAAVY